MFTARTVLHIPRELVNKPVLCHLLKVYDLEFNILKAQVMEDEDGEMILELSGAEKRQVQEAIRYLETEGVGVKALSKKIDLDMELCTHCGACVGQCSTGALVTEPETKHLCFVEDKCIACELCVPACPYKAISAVHEVE